MVELAVELYGQRVGVIAGDNYRSFDITVDHSAIATFGANSRTLSMAVPLALEPKRSLAKRRRNYFAGLLPEDTVTIAPMYDVVPQTHYDTDGEFAFRVNGKLEHASITRADIIDEVTKWGIGRPEAVVNETLEVVRELAATKTPHPSAEPSLQERIQRFSQNLLDNRMVGA
jgi:hypothetical protein